MCDPDFDMVSSKGHMLNSISLRLFQSNARAWTARHVAGVSLFSESLSY